MNTTEAVAAYLGGHPTEGNARLWAMALELAEIAIKLGVVIVRHADHGMIGDACTRTANDVEDIELGFKVAGIGGNNHQSMTDVFKRQLRLKARLLRQLGQAFGCLFRGTAAAFKYLTHRGQAKELEQFTIEAAEAKRQWDALRSEKEEQ